MRKASSEGEAGFRVVGLTGGIASGKSTVSGMLRDLSVRVIDADVIAREVVAPRTPGLAAIVDEFGDGVLDGDGDLNRKRLGALVFSDPLARARLEAIVHPLIAVRAAERIQEERDAGTPFVVYDAALLVEWGGRAMLDTLVVVAVAEDTQVERIVARDGLTEVEARQRIASQLPLSAKTAVADVVIDNSGSLEATRAQVVALVARLVAR
jgi:dephospho-CoA kinase